MMRPGPRDVPTDVLAIECSACNAKPGFMCGTYGERVCLQRVADATAHYGCPAEYCNVAANAVVGDGVEAEAIRLMRECDAMDAGLAEEQLEPKEPRPGEDVPKSVRP